MMLFRKINQKKESLEGFNHNVVGLILILMTAMLFSACETSKTDNRQPTTENYYTCSMHPQIHKYQPGNCPVCGMKLIKVTPSTNKDTMPLDSSLSYLVQPVTKTAVGSYKVIEPVKAAPGDTITANGYIGFDKRAVSTVNMRISGRIEKLYAKYSNQKISKGQPLMTIYSPELVSAQKDLLQAVKNNDRPLVTALKEKLLNLGMQAGEIQKVLQSAKPLTRITIYSPYNGISQSLNIREGMYVNRGQAAFSIQNMDKTWAILNVFGDDVLHIQAGDPVILYSDADPGNIIKGRIDFIPPYREENGKTTQVRIYLNNLPDGWKIGTLIHGRIAINEQNKGWYIPLSAVNSLGMHKVIWVQDKEYSDVFHVREIETGLQTGDSIEVVSGIEPGDKIAANATYMTGSDAFIE